MDVRYMASLLALGVSGFCATVFAAADGSQLQLPIGADVAIIVFEDLQCPDCAQAHPKLLEAATAAKVPLVIHDFPIPRHAWAFPAAVLARYFARQSPALGVEFRSFIFQSQPNINLDNLRQFGETFAQDHQQTLPADVDPDGTLKALVQADFDLGRQIHLEYVPLIFVTGAAAGPSNAVEVTDLGKLDGVIAGMKASRVQ